ncbi:hypothetical protein NMG60_11002967 [Bertholletia excelsa]
MASSSFTFTFVAFLVPVSSLIPTLSLTVASDSGHSSTANKTFWPDEELQRLNRARAYLRKINKPSVKTIQSPEGDVIDCVATYLQPAFDHPLLKGRKPLEAPERPRSRQGRQDAETERFDQFQPWISPALECPEGTVPIRRTTEADILRASSIRKFGRKSPRQVNPDNLSSGHEHAVASVKGGEYYGAKASINVWAPRVTDEFEFSLSQLWVISGKFGIDLNTIEAGWQVSPKLYGDNLPRLFIYWTSDSYHTTGCYNLLCPGFVQTNNKIALGAAISPSSAYGGRQFDINIMIWKDPKHGHWWLELGSGLVVGYWSSFLFSRLKTHGQMVQFGGEIMNTGSTGSLGRHTSTQMGSGHFSGEGFRKASYFRNLEVVDWDNSLIPLSNLRLLADHPNCYDIKAGRNSVWGDYIFYGGPGRNPRCP